MGAAALAVAVAAGAATGDEEALAQKYSPVVASSSSPRNAAPASRTSRSTSTLLFGQPTVALRGPWNTTDLVKIGPTRAGPRRPLRVPPRLPGRARSTRAATTSAGQRRSRDGKGTPTVYAHVATDPAHPGKLSLQYWFFYVFNDFNNLHEGDWEMIQLDFDATDAARGARDGADEVGYSSHEGAERADWGDDKLELVDGTHPVVYPAAGSHANKYNEALYLGSSADAGRRLRRHPRAARRAPAGREDDPERPRRRPRRRSRGSRSRGAGASCSRRSSTARPGRT